MARRSTSESIKARFCAIKYFNGFFYLSCRIDENEDERKERLAKWDNYLKEGDADKEPKKEVAKIQVEEEIPENVAAEDVSIAENDSE